MDNAFGPVFLKNRRNPLTILQIADFQRSPFYPPIVASNQVVEYNGLVPRRGQRLASVATDIPCPAGDQNLCHPANIGNPRPNASHRSRLAIYRTCAP